MCSACGADVWPITRRTISYTQGRSQALGYTGSGLGREVFSTVAKDGLGLRIFLATLLVIYMYTWHDRMCSL
jgi:hypothetical protein